MSDVFDFVVIGAGSAGCVVAGRLTEDPAVTVCVLEAGGNGNSALVNIPAAAVVMLPTRLNNWAFETVPQAGLDGRKGYQPRGKALGDRPPSTRWSMYADIVRTTIIGRR